MLISRQKITKIIKADWLQFSGTGQQRKKGAWNTYRMFTHLLRTYNKQRTQKKKRSTVRTLERTERKKRSHVRVLYAVEGTALASLENSRIRHLRRRQQEPHKDLLAKVGTAKQLRLHLTPSLSLS